MNVSQDVTGIFRSPDLSIVAAQAVQAGESAFRQTALNHQADAVRRQAQVVASELSGQAPTVTGEGQGQASDRGRGRARRTTGAQGPESGELHPPDPPAPVHRIDLVA